MKYDTINGIFGSLVYSQDKRYRLIARGGIGESEVNWQVGGVVSAKDGSYDYDFLCELKNPSDFVIANNGNIIGFDLPPLGIGDPEVIVWNAEDEESRSWKLMSNPSKSGISACGKYGVFSTCNSRFIDADKIFIIDIDKYEPIAMLPIENYHISELSIIDDRLLIKYFDGANSSLIKFIN